MTQRLSIENEPEGVVWRKLAAALLAGSILFVAPACEANFETDEGVEEDEEDADVDLDDDDDVDDDDADLDDDEEDDDVDVEIEDEE